MPTSASGAADPLQGRGWGFWQSLATPLLTFSSPKSQRPSPRHSRHTTASPGAQAASLQLTAVIGQSAGQVRTFSLSRSQPPFPQERAQSFGQFGLVSPMSRSQRRSPQTALQSAAQLALVSPWSVSQTLFPQTLQRRRLSPLVSLYFSE
ncbi:MAG: hypothetical protein QMD04_11855 [Anaerolineales bacterium]|nr:hypothetical protein [Anaerolineales bacterium]